MVMIMLRIIATFRIFRDLIILLASNSSLGRLLRTVRAFPVPLEGHLQLPPFAIHGLCWGFCFGLARAIFHAFL